MSTNHKATELSLRTIPDGLVSYHQSQIFDEDSFPQSLRRRHNTKEGSWAKINILDGSATYVEEGAMGEARRLLSSAESQVVLPKVWHRLEIQGSVCVRIEFFSVPAEVAG